MSDNVLMAKAKGTKGTDRRDDRITFRAPAAVRVALEREAAAQRRSVSDLILLMIEDALGMGALAKRKGR